MTHTAAPSRSDLELQESLASTPSALNADGTVDIHIIRPTVGQGLGNHKYTAEMLEANAGVFTGWKMYIDHQSEAAKKAAQGLPRSIRDLGGRILESRWDPNVPAEGRFGQGAVVGTVKPVGQVKKLIEEDPELLEASIRARATDVHQGVENGQKVWVVEGINSSPPGSVDWVSEGGAGGRVADLLEGLVTEDPATAEGGNAMKELTEALADPESDASKAVREIVSERTEEAVKKERQRHAVALEEAKKTAHEEGVAEGRAEAVKLSEAAQAKADRKVELTTFQAKATELVEAAKLPPKFAARVKDQFKLDGDEPTTGLDVDTQDELEEAVKGEIREAKALLADANPALVEGQGQSTPDGDDSKPSKPATKPFFEEFLEEAGVNPDRAYADNKELG